MERDKVTTVFEAARVLLSVCDGAVTEDGRGYNKLDSHFVRSIISRCDQLQRKPTEKQEKALHKTLRKYRKQLHFHGIEYDQIKLIDREDERIEQNRVKEQRPFLDYEDNPRLPLFILKSPYSFKDKAKSLPWSFWDSDNKRWTYSSDKVEFFEAIKPLIKDGTIVCSKSAIAKLSELAKISQKRVEVSQIKRSNPVSDRTMPTSLKPFSHQIKAFQIGTTVDQAALLMEQGTGKTLSAISVAGYRYQKGEVKKLLVIVPLSVASVWEEEFNKVADFPFEIKLLTKMKEDKRDQKLNGFTDKALNIVVINYEATWRYLEQLLKWNPDMVIVDESQKIKNARAKQSKAIHKIGDQTRYKLILSGTPITQGPLDTWSQYRFLNPTIFGKKFVTFRNRYAVMGGYGGYEVIRYKNLEELAEKAHSIAYRITKEEALDLPPQVNQIIKIRLDNKTTEIYKEMENEFLVEFEGNRTASAPIILTQLLRLQQITGGFLPVDDSDQIEQISSSKLKALEELVADLPESKKVVIFARFIPEIKAIEEIMNGLGRQTVTLMGKTKDRANTIISFQKNPQTTVLIAQIQTGGLGITLTASDLAIFYSTTFSFADYEQAKARIHRIGQSRSVTYIHLLAEDTVDEQILEVLQTKGNMAELIVDKLSRKFSQKSGSTPFTSGENYDILNSVKGQESNKEGTDKMAKTNKKEKEETTTQTTDGMKGKLAQLKAKAEKKAPAGKTVKETPEVTKNKVKKDNLPAETKTRKKEPKAQDPNIVLLKDLAAEVGKDPKEIRKILRKNYARPEGHSWYWEKGSKELEEVRKLVRGQTEKAPAEPKKAKAKEEPKKAGKKTK